jgi:hypothetical protein
MDPEKNIETKLEQLAQAIPSGTSFVDGVMSRIETSSDTLHKQSIHISLVRRLLMKNTVKFAAVAVVLFMAFAGWNLFDKSSSTSVVWANVSLKVQQAKTIRYRTKTIIPQQSDLRETIVWISNVYGLKMENYIGGKLSHIQYDLPQRLVSVLPDIKEYLEIQANQEQYSKIIELQSREANPRERVHQMMDCAHKFLGKSTIDGVEVEGLESNDPKISGSQRILMRLWVDVKTSYPVQIEEENSILDESSAGDKRTIIRTIFYDFQWNVDTDATIFVPNIPPDYKAQPKIQLPKFDEPAAIEGLRKFAEMTRRYPVSMGINEFMEDINKTIKDVRASDPNYLKGLTEDQKNQKMREQIAPFQSLSIFYAILLQEQKDPAYFGKTITPGDAKAVLLRWKTKDTTYRVIMGDLSLTEMSADQLKQIEPQPTP